MSVCLSYQSVYCDRYSSATAVRYQVAALGVLLAVLAFKVMIKIEETDLGYELSQARRHHSQILLDKQELQLQLSVITRPDIIRKEASARLGLRELQPQQVKRVKLITG